MLKYYIAKYLRFLFGKKPKDFKQIPIFINNYNRLETTKKLIGSLEIRGYANIHILDNKSTFPPLLEFYKTTPYKVHLLNKNYGYKAFWKSGVCLKFLSKNYVYTDSDVVLKDDCPADFLEFFYELLTKYPNVHKVGFSLQIDDIPDCYKHKKDVIKWEKRFFQHEKEPNVYIAPIDTTFALYKPFSKKDSNNRKSIVLRTGKPYQTKHLPWYVDSNNLCDEELYYINSIHTSTHWSEKK